MCSLQRTAGRRATWSDTRGGIRSRLRSLRYGDGRCAGRWAGLARVGSPCCLWRGGAGGGRWWQPLGPAVERGRAAGVVPFEAARSSCRAWSAVGAGRGGGCACGCGGVRVEGPAQGGGRVGGRGPPLPALSGYPSSGPAFGRRGDDLGERASCSGCNGIRPTAWSWKSTAVPLVPMQWQGERASAIQ